MYKKKHRIYECKICNKPYASSGSLWFHNNKFHTNEITPHSTLQEKNDEIIVKNVISRAPRAPNVISPAPTAPNATNIISTGQNVISPIQNKHFCKFCNKNFVRNYCVIRHEKICKTKLSEITKLKEENDKLKEQLKNNSKIITNNNTNNTNTNSQNTNNSHNTNNNHGTINNVTVNKFGSENISVLSAKEIKQLIKNNNFLVDIIKMLNFNDKHPQNHSFCNTSLEGKYISVLNTATNKIEKFNKNDFYDKVLTNSFDKMEHLALVLEFDKDMKEQIKEKYKDHLDKKLTHYQDVFHTNKIYKKSYKNNINELSYNNKNLILDTWSKIPEIETGEDDLDISEDAFSPLTSDSSDNELSC